jgi:hypothetical protein
MERPIKIAAEGVVATSIQVNDSDIVVDENKEIKFASCTASVRYYTSYVKNWEANWLKDDAGPKVMTQQ